jgi:hypothetical protein
MTPALPQGGLAPVTGFAARTPARALRGDLAATSTTALPTAALPWGKWGRAGFRSRFQ